jgi:hypothetical protein
MNAAEARRIVAELGLTERVRENVAAMPPLSTEQVALIQRIFTRAAKTKGSASADPSLSAPDEGMNGAHHT